VSITIDEVLSEAGGRITSSFIAQEVLSDAKIAYSKREQQLGEVAMRELERRVVLSVIDRRWRDHLYEMDYLKDGIGLRAMAQRDPLVEYQREGFALFQNMMAQIREESIGFLFNLEVEVTGGEGQARVAAKGLVGSSAARCSRPPRRAPSRRRRRRARSSGQAPAVRRVAPPPRRRRRPRSVVLSASARRASRPPRRRTVRSAVPRRRRAAEAAPAERGPIGGSGLRNG
jgi:preprotein translocase subunit SecA